MKRGQTEMIGLVVIVILITLGMLFAAQFALKESPQKKIFTRKGLSYSTMSTIMKTTVYEDNCQGDFRNRINPQVGKDLLEDCAKNKDYSPDGFSLYHCNDEHSCVFLEKFIAELLNETLGSWSKHYEFSSTLIQVSGDSSEELFEPIIFGGGCRGKEKDSSGLFPIHTSNGLIQSELFLCD
jgi:hypothetical protein